MAKLQNASPFQNPCQSWQHVLHTVVRSVFLESTTLYASLAALPYMLSSSSKPSSLALVTTFKMLIASLRTIAWSLSNFLRSRCKSCIPTPALSTKAASKCSGKSSQICQYNNVISTQDTIHHSESPKQLNLKCH